MSALATPPSSNGSGWHAGVQPSRFGSKERNPRWIHLSTPVIIYAVSPKVIHTTPADFMAVVQSLTSVHAAAAASSSSSLAGGATAGNPHGNRGSAQFSPAARLAAFEKTATSSPSASASARILNREVVDDVVVEIIRSPEERRLGGGGILSPGPASLPWISPGMFTPTALFTPPPQLPLLPPSIQLVASPDTNNLFFSNTGIWFLLRRLIGISSTITPTIN
ncbi:hypothetical protein ZIOFF_071811 [Zingiber officinale]|uniref:VQ domain-containing protein n=1 Tax=Zingiber officinale TaxID=94328 RepID=A0A8J5CC20_ZINOF|nr:hypothetical protein ZIOFF_071811 [Zingiber officinale]